MGYSKQTTFPFVSCTGRRLTEDRANVRTRGADVRPAVAAGTQQAVRGQNVPVHDMCGVHYGLRDCAIHEALSAIGTKRTLAWHLHMSAFDPKRTYTSDPRSPEPKLVWRLVLYAGSDRVRAATCTDSLGRKRTRSR
jgi:hypothetical protein